MSLAKPVLRGHLNRSIARNLVIGIAASLVIGAVFKFTVSEPRKQRYAEFYKNYDGGKADFRHMRDLGLLQSASPGEKD